MLYAIMQVYPNTDVVGMVDLVLASASPRRQEILRDLGLEFSCRPQAIDETPHSGEKPLALVQRLALEKARSALASLSDADHSLVLGSDTIVVCDERILGKPADREDALAMLGLLAGRTHQVITAVAVINHVRELIDLSQTQVSFRSLSHEEILAYWQTGEPLDKAGAYAIQGLGGMFISSISGSYSGVVGLPVYETVNLLAQFGLDAEYLLNKQQ